MLGWLDGIRRWINAQAVPQGVVTPAPAPAPAETPAETPAGPAPETGPVSGTGAPDAPPPEPAPASAPEPDAANSTLTPDASISPSEVPSTQLPPVAPAFRTHPLRAVVAFVTQSMPVFLVTLALLFGLLYFVLGGFLTSTIDDNPAFRPAEADLPPGGSVAVAMTSAVLNREINEHGWTPDDPWFYPSSLIDNMPAWQRGIRMAVYRFAGALAQHHPAEAELAQAHEALAYPPGRWWIGPDWPWVRTASGSRYDDAIDDIRAYNARVANGSAPLLRDAPTLATMLEQLAAALAADEEALERQVAGGIPADNGQLGNDEIFYAVRGEAYASMLILAGLREDFAPLIRQRQLSARWANMARSLEAAVDINPLIVTSGDPGSFLIKNHLMEQGFAVQRARNQLLALAADLRKAPPAAATARK